MFAMNPRDDRIATLAVRVRFQNRWRRIVRPASPARSFHTHEGLLPTNTKFSRAKLVAGLTLSPPVSTF
jgi:hypothetical protein